jgi:hypothetical protein
LLLWTSHVSYLEWKPYTRDERAVMIIDRSFSVEHDLDPAQPLAWGL